jgi:hypothetical protein
LVIRLKSFRRNVKPNRHLLHGFSHDREQETKGTGVPACLYRHKNPVVSLQNNSLTLAEYFQVR